MNSMNPAQYFAQFKAALVFDLDGTIITQEETDKVLESDFVAVCRALRAAGYCLVWNSDTSYEGLLNWECQLGLANNRFDLYTCESGAFTIGPRDLFAPTPLYGGDLSILWHTDSRLVVDFTRLRQAFCESLLKLGFQVVLTHASLFCEQRPIMPGHSMNLVAYDSTRHVSCSIEVRVIHPDGTMHAHPGQVAEVHEIFERHVQRVFDTDGSLVPVDQLRFEWGPEGWIAVQVPQNSKGNSLQHLISLMGGARIPVHMFEDSFVGIDCCGVNGVTVHAVGNAKPALVAAINGIHAKGCFVHGTLEIIRQLGLL